MTSLVNSMLFAKFTQAHAVSGRGLPSPLMAILLFVHLCVPESCMTYNFIVHDGI